MISNWVGYVDPLIQQSSTQFINKSRSYISCQRDPPTWHWCCQSVVRALQCKNNLILAKLLQLVCLPLKIKNQLEDIASYAYDKSMIPSVNQVEYQSHQHEDDCRLLNHKTSRSKTLHQVELLLSEHLYSVLQLVFLFKTKN